MTEVPAPDKVDEMRETHQRITQAEFESLLADYQNVMETPSGIRVLRDILAFTGYRKSQFNKHAAVMAHSITENKWMCLPTRDDSGTTAVTAMIESSTGKVMVANVGDSRAVLVRRVNRANVKVIPLTTDQDAGNKSEVKRIKAANGVIDEDGYINRGLTSDCVGVQTARSLGDFDVKFPQRDGAAMNDGEDDEIAPTFHSMSVIAVPECAWCQMYDDDVLVLGCDGMFEATQGSATWIGKSVKRLLQNNASAEEMAEALAREAIDMGSMDNVSCIVVTPGG